MANSSPLVKSERSGAVALLTIDSPPVNALGHGVRSALLAALEAALADPEVRAVAILGAGRTFIAGADITEFGKPRVAPLIPDLIEAMEKSAKPVVAAIHGFALGGGLELAMGCHYRIAAPDARVGQPEVKLGIIPGAGGTQRLPRLVGVPAALEMIVGGEPIVARAALERGLIDEIAPGDLAAAAAAAALRLAERHQPLRRVRDLPPKDVPTDAEFFNRMRAGTQKRKRGVEAPLACVAAVEAAATLPFDEGMARERALFAELVDGEQARAQRYFFFAEREAGKIPDLAAEVAALPVRQAAVIGGGTMGGGIAMCFANAGLPVTIIETSAKALESGLATVRRNYATSAARGGLAKEAVEERMALIQGSLDFAEAEDSDLVIEAVFEELALKQEVFRKLGQIVRPDAILATNTSYQNVDEIAAAAADPSRVCGMHFFSPANVMRLVEVVRGKATAKPTLATAMAVARKLRKVPVPVGVCYGFVGNRMLSQRGRAGERLLLEGALPQQIDAAMVEFGFPMGPFAASDLAGLDVGWRARKSRGMKFAIADAICEAGRFGQKTGGGYYHYEPGSRAPLADPEVERIIRAVAAKEGVARRAVAAPEIVERMLYPMINEGARILEEGIALRPGDIDVIWVYGYGWPVHRGGPMFHADAIGLKTLAQKLEEQSRRLADPALAPAPLLARRAAEGKRFADLGR